MMICFLFNVIGATKMRCLMKSYDRITQGCCQGNVYNRSVSGCCNNKLYNISHQGCCHNINIYKIPFQGCCGDIVYNKHHDAIQYECCNGQVFNTALEKCFDNAIKNKTIAIQVSESSNSAVISRENISQKSLICFLVLTCLAVSYPIPSH
ncbi:unnamed protein product [Mytilus edulis]|uniref:Galaxin-like repeats domain-containing protein n=1 Tax=Mytilus edulis TaxID=6550 RepID=A0A8S3TI62_MYTED|nr:unnamed protein product [Mytilus edulis]